MKVIDNKENAILLELSYHEFNALRESISAVLISCSKEEIPTLTGCTKNELLDLGLVMSEIAEKSHIAL